MNSRSIILFLMILFSVKPIYSDNSKNKLVKRNIMILPFININKVEKYNYLGDMLRDALLAELLKTNNYNFVKYEDIKNKIIQLKLTPENLLDESIVKNLAIKLKSDVVVLSRYIIIDESIMIQNKAIDIFTSEIVAASTINGEMGLDIFRIIDASSKDMADKMIKKLKIVEKSYFDQMNEILKKEENLKNKKIYTPILKTGIILTCIGGALLASGLPILIYDLVSYNTTVNSNFYNGPRTKTGYNDYYNSYNIYVGLLSESITSISIGGVLLGIGIPLIIYDKRKNKKVSFNINFDFPSQIYLCFKL